MSITDYLQLNELKIIKTFRENLKKTITKTENLITVKDGVLFTWDFENRCVLTLNLKAARSREGDDVSHQNLLPLSPVLFEPELISVNDSGTLLIVAGQCGVLVMELPTRYPPYGGFDHNKEIVYCRSHSLEERLLTCNDIVQVQQVRFHPGSTTDSHILLLTSDNVLRLYNIVNSTVTNLGVYSVGDKPMGSFPGTKKSLLASLGDVAVDFVVGQSEILDDNDNLLKSAVSNGLVWPVYVLMGDGRVFYIHIPINNTMVKPILKGPLPANYPNGDLNIESCSLLIINTNPEILCIGNSNGCIYHTFILPITKENYEDSKTNSNKIQLKHLPKKELLCFEMIELELGILLSTLDDDKKYCCPLFLHKDESKFNRYFVTHTAGVHCVTIECCENLQNYVNSDSGGEIEEIFLTDSTIEYFVCTKVAISNEKLNPIIGFSLYYEPVSLISMLSNGNLISLNLLTTTIIKENETLLKNVSVKDNNSFSVRNILKEPFDEYVEKILKKTYNNKQPIIKLNEKNNYTQKECYELLQKSVQAIHETYFENLLKIREEILKRVKTLKLMKEYQLSELERLNNEKIKLQETCEILAEKYEDLKDKQNLIMKRCEKLLVFIIQKKFEQSDAEKNYLNELNTTKDKLDLYKTSIEKLRMKVKYQKIQMDNWKAQETKKISCFSESHETTIRNNLKDMSHKIADMIQQINEFKLKLNIK